MPSRNASSRVDRAAREQEVARGALAGEQRQPPDVARAEVHAELRPPGIAIRAPGHGDAEVARDRELHARAHRRTVDRGDDRRRMIDDRVEDELERGPERVDRARRPRLRRARSG